MSHDWAQDIKDMHEHYRFNQAVDKLTSKELVEYFVFRTKFLKEELKELEDSNSPDDAIDALIDLCVVAIGTLDLYKVDVYKAWDRVLEANMAKKVGVKESRPNKLGIDLIKPPGWEAPTHVDNRSLFDFVFLEKWVTPPK